ncbi:undecaprenyldiphospho-muramoylpentapeptide beta-N-acetylglucosaminyltransferase [candidate division KSB1 bacterium]|nr:undecaprenyldiphospho-muramoylpentapeptide beta-N-acetylglucosaminyltransferase [candidate division KSB1 bacterium]
MSNAETYIFAGGGTGGHLYPAVAMAQRIKELRPQSYIRFVGTRRGLENRLIPELGFPLSCVAVRGVTRSLTLKNILVPFVLIKGVVQCFSLLLKYKPNAVIGTGGYVSGPVVFSAALLGIPTLIQEQNSYPGLTTRLLSRWVKRVHISFEESRSYFKRTDNLVLTGNPVRKFELSKNKKQACAKFGLNPDYPVLLVYGGSQGAHAINQALLDSLAELMTASSLQIIWSTGQADYNAIQRAVKSYADRIWISAYISDMEAAYRAADMALTRAGALTIAELTLAGVPSILVPYPYAAANHQYTNARALEKNNACIVLMQDKLERLSTELMSLLKDEQKRSQMAEAMRQSSFPNATDEIVNSIFAIARRDV